MARRQSLSGKNLVLCSLFLTTAWQLFKKLVIDLVTFSGECNFVFPLFNPLLYLLEGLGGFFKRWREPQVFRSVKLSESGKNPRLGLSVEVLLDGMRFEVFWCKGLMKLICNTSTLKQQTTKKSYLILKYRSATGWKWNNKTMLTGLLKRKYTVRKNLHELKLVVKISIFQLPNKRPLQGLWETIRDPNFLLTSDYSYKFNILFMIELSNYVPIS